MTTYNVSGQSALLSALKSADGSDTIVLSGGNYGSISLPKSYSSNVKITSASESNQAVFSKISTNGVSNITIDNVKFAGVVKGGYGTGTGLDLSQGTNVTIQNSTFTNFNIGIDVWATNNLDILNNDLNGIAYDGMTIGHTQNLLIQGNDINMNPTPNVDHQDGIQLYNQGSKAVASNITIRGNSLSSDGTWTHSIYMGNNDAKSSGSSSEFYKNVLIENNSIGGGHMLGVAVGQANGVTIRGNQVLQHEDVNSSKTVNKPVILVAEKSSNVSITNNTVLDTPSAANNNWQDTSPKGGNWNISGNKVVGLNTTVSATASKTSANAVSTSEAPVASAGGNGDADTFRFEGTDVMDSTTDKISDLDFSDGDLLELIKYQNGTFEDVAGGNIVWNNTAGSYVEIDSVTDLQELVASSSAISAKVSGDTLTLDIAQNAGTHHLMLEGLGAEYQNSFDSALF